LLIFLYHKRMKVLVKVIACLVIFCQLSHYKADDIENYDDSFSKVSPKCSTTTVKKGSNSWIPNVDDDDRNQNHTHCQFLKSAQNISELVPKDVVMLSVDISDFSNLTSLAFYEYSDLIRLKITFGMIKRLEHLCFERQNKLQVTNLTFIFIIYFLFETFF